MGITQILTCSPLWWLPNQVSFVNMAQNTLEMCPYWEPVPIYYISGHWFVSSDLTVGQRRKKKMFVPPPQISKYKKSFIKKK